MQNKMNHTKWEYTTESKFYEPGIFTVTATTNPARVSMPEESREEYLNRMGRDGWELIAEKLVGTARYGTHVEFTFKRAIPEVCNNPG